ncbi:MAG: hypothetical protein ACREDS_14290, partial [Limisphaerales bacterium]
AKVRAVRHGNKFRFLINIFNFNLNAAQPTRQQIVNCRENYKKDEAENAHNNWHKKVNESHYFQWRSTEDNHGNGDKTVNKAHQDIHRGHDFAGLQN